MRGRGNSILDNIVQIKDDEFRKISSLVYKEFGINLTEKKRSLVVGRLQKILKARKLSTFSEYIDFVENGRDKTALSELVNQISTNHTFFFREFEHFNYLVKNALPEIEKYRLAQGSKKIRAWCAASSSGEEPYTIILHMMEYFGVNYKNWNAGLLATDISEDALRSAVSGKYKADTLSKIDIGIKSKYFHSHNDGYEVNDDLKKEIIFRKFNLITPQFPFKGDFDFIFCRNVMIYFDSETKERLVNKLYKQLRPGGFLFIGHSETLNGLNTPFEYVKTAVYKRGK
jgi:chemotaxis protein methyltransferase CheR